MTDRELLEAAARAAGVNIKWNGPDEGEWCFIPSATEPHNRRVSDAMHGVIWSPLNDGGDALELAVKLGMIVDTHGLHTRICMPFSADILSYETHNGDPYAATRRAIVRAAAVLAGEKP